MVIFEDTRQQAGKHENIHKYCEKHGIRIVRSKLAVGDYMLAGEGGGGISVDSKQSVAEIASNCFQEHDRFRAECLLAKECGIQLIVLVEELMPGGRLDRWKAPPKCRVSPETLRKAMITMQQEYGVKFRFCDGRSTGKAVIEYLKGEKI